MATLNLTSPVFYKNGEPGVSAVVGYESLSNRVVRYTLHTGQSGAGQVALAFSGNWKGNGTLPELNFYIGTDPDSHGGAGAGSPYTGTLVANGYDYSGSAEVMLLPDRDYYVWVFPATKVFGWIQWSYASGAAVADCTGGALTVLTAQPGTLGSPMTLELTRYTEFTHTVTCTLGSQSLTVCENSTETRLTWTPPLSLAEEIPDAAAATAVFSVTSLKDGAAVGTVQRAVTLSVPESVVPTVTAQWQDLSGAFDSFGTCVQLVSRLGVTAEAQGAYGSTVRSSALTLNGSPYAGGTLTAAGEVTLTVTVTDSRGRTGSQSHTLPVAAYAVPWVRVDASRCDADGTPNEMGEYAVLTLTGQSTQVAEKNRAVLTFAYGEATETVAVSVGSFTERRIIPADSTATLPLWAELSDAFTKSPRASMVLSIGYATVDFLGGGRGIAFGTTATKEGFTCAMDTDFSGHRVTGLPAPSETADAASKGYVDEAVQQVADRITPGAVPEAFTVTANTPVSVSMAEGELYHLCYESESGSGDIFLLANGQKPTRSAYTFAGSGENFTDGQISYGGETVFTATAQLSGGTLVVSGKDIRGNGTGTGNSLLIWEGMGAVSALTFTRSGSLMVIGAGSRGEQGPAGKDAPQESVLYTAQTLTEAQKEQARENIGVDHAAKVDVSKPIDPNWDKWNDIRYSYGFDKTIQPIFNTVNGTLESDTMLSVRGGKGRWGWHNFEGWSPNELSRLTMLMGKHHETFGCIQTFSPNGLYEARNRWGWVKLGCDELNEGTDFSKNWATCYTPITLAPQAAPSSLADYDLNPQFASDAVPVGTMYFDEEEQRIKLYTKTGWQPIAFVGEGGSGDGSEEEFFEPIPSYRNGYYVAVETAKIVSGGSLGRIAAFRLNKNTKYTVTRSALSARFRIYLYYNTSLDDAIEKGAIGTLIASDTGNTSLDTLSFTNSDFAMAVVMLSNKADTTTTITAVMDE